MPPGAPRTPAAPGSWPRPRRAAPSVSADLGKQGGLCPPPGVTHKCRCGAQFFFLHGGCFPLRFFLKVKPHGDDVTIVRTLHDAFIVQGGVQYRVPVIENKGHNWRENHSPMPGNPSRMREEKSGTLPTLLAMWLIRLLSCSSGNGRDMSSAPFS